MARRSDEISHSRSAAKRTAVVLALVAVAFYVAFILMGVLNQ